ncbi:MAG: phage tail protein [Pseudohongiellaceae bacterium]
MKKLELLRKHMLDSVPGLKRDPDRLLTFIERGQIEFHRGQSLSHQYSVPVRIILTDHQGELNTVIVPLLQWLSRYQPDLDPQEAVSFDAELLSHHSWDLAIEVALTERVVATVDCDAGRIEVENRTPEFPIDACPAEHWQLFMRDTESEEEFTLIAEWGSNE